MIDLSAETSSTHKRGKNTAAVFSMQGVGSLLATVVCKRKSMLANNNIIQGWIRLLYGSSYQTRRCMAFMSCIWRCSRPTYDLFPSTNG